MPITAALIGGGTALLGGLLGGSSARSAARTQAGAQLDAAQLAANEARFRPVGITTRFGGSQFQMGIPGVSAPVATDFATPEEFQAAQSAYQTRLQNEGRVTGASYSLDPTLRAYQERFLGLAGGGLTQAEGAQQQFAPLGTAAQGLFGLGQQYLAQSPEQAAQQYMMKQQDLLAPSRERQMAQLQTNLFNTGRGGLSVGATGARPSGAGGLGASTPETEAYYNALAQQDAQLAAQAMQAGQQQVAFGAGLFGTGGNLLTQGYGGQAAALGPYEAYLQQMKTLESLGQQPLELGINIGAKGQSNAAAQAMLSTSPSRESYAANAFNPFAESLMSASRNPALQRGVSPYASALGQSAIYGNQNVYGFGGGGTVPSQFSLFGEY
jgi:hypothetical protein